MVSLHRGIYVFDDLYTQEELKQFRKILLDTGVKRTSVFDGSALEDNDNVRWIATYKVCAVGNDIVYVFMIFEE